MASGNPSPLFRSGYSGNVYRHKRSLWRPLRSFLSVLVVVALIAGAFYVTYRFGRQHPLVHSATGVISSTGGSSVTLTADGVTYSVSHDVAWFESGSDRAQQGTAAGCLSKAIGARVKFGWVKIAKLDQRVVIWVRC